MTLSSSVPSVTHSPLRSSGSLLRSTCSTSLSWYIQVHLTWHWLYTFSKSDNSLQQYVQMWYRSTPRLPLILTVSLYWPFSALTLGYINWWYTTSRTPGTSTTIQAVGFSGWFLWCYTWSRNSSFTQQCSALLRTPHSLPRYSSLVTSPSLLVKIITLRRALLYTLLYVQGLFPSPL